MGQSWLLVLAEPELLLVVITRECHAELSSASGCLKQGLELILFTVNPLWPYQRHCMLMASNARGQSKTSRRLLHQ